MILVRLLFGSGRRFVQLLRSVRAKRSCLPVSHRLALVVEMLVSGVRKKIWEVFLRDCNPAIGGPLSGDSYESACV